MVKTLMSITLLAGLVLPCQAASPFTCKANGDGWSIVGTPARRLACTLRCVLRDSGGNQDAVSCAPVVSPDGKGEPVCEGFTIGKRWTSATLVAVECATVAP